MHKIKTKTERALGLDSLRQCLLEPMKKICVGQTENVGKIEFLGSRARKRTLQAKAEYILS